ncbi:malto-oligosyltrehalose synthase [Homoserinimonas sp. A447]
MMLPRSTYRLQIRASFDLDAAAAVVDYLTLLGADWLYLSPLLTAEEGSDHGYDVVDSSAIDPARGGLAGLDRFSAAATVAGRGVLVDVVPNHVGVASPRANAWWWDVLTHGQASRYAEAFDVDWEAGAGRIRLPVLGDDGVDALQVVGGELRYHEHRFPLAPGTAGDGPAQVHAAQHYELVHWRRADSELNYRRFFAVNTLAAVRVEVPWVFEESHREILRWVKSGQVHGLRIDHPDGLADPGGYLSTLHHETAGAYVVVEKILEGREQLPPHWPVAGTTGYDALADIDRVLVDPDGQRPLDSLEKELHGRVAPWSELVHDGKRAIADGILRSEVLRVARLVPGIADEPADSLHSRADAIAELLACFPVYRSYLPFGIEHLHAALRQAGQRRPELGAELDAVAAVLADPSHPAAVRFQQTSGMVMAKGVEDTAFYRFSRLTSLNEVGADPGEFSIPVSEFHDRQQQRQATLPASMTTLSTHDTKRSEDVRARLNTLSELPMQWASTLFALRLRSSLDDPPLANLLWQAVIGAWPLSRERLHAYAEKAAREAGNSTSWSDPDAGFERAMHAMVDSAFDDPEVNRLVTDFVDLVREPGWSNSLSAKLLQLTMPGVPDVYQGSELWDFSLVDPDNRRPVDFAQRRRLLAQLDSGWRPAVDDSGAAKLLVTSRALRLRRDRPEWFSRYLPVPVTGEAAAHVIAVDRGEAIVIATRLPVGLAAAGGWRDTALTIPARRWVDELTGTVVEGPRLPLEELLHPYPVALLRAADRA